MFAFFDEKSQIVYKSTINECEVFLFKYFEDYTWDGARKHPVTLGLQNI